MTTVPRLVVLDVGAFWFADGGITGVSSELRFPRSLGANSLTKACGRGVLEDIEDEVR